MAVDWPSSGPAGTDLTAVIGVKKSLNPAQPLSQLVVFSVMAALYLILSFGPLGDLLDMLGYDQVAERVHSEVGHERPVLVAIDDATVSALGRWPWPRHRLAELITKVDQAGAKAIALDVLIAENSNRFSDQALVAAIKSVDHLVMPIAGSPALPNLTIGLWPPLRGLVTYAHTVVPITSHGSAWWTEPSLEIGDSDWPAMAVALVGADPPAEWFLTPFSYPPPFDQLSAIELFDGASSTSLLNEKYVLIGVTATGASGTFNTPFATAVTGVELQAFQAAAVANKQWWQMAPGAVRIVVWLAFIGFMALTFKTGFIGLVLVLLMSLFSLIISHYVLQSFGQWLAPMPFIMAMLVGAAAWLAHDWHRHRRAAGIERARAEATLAAMVDAVIATDSNNNIVVVNQAAERLLGRLRDTLLGHPLDTIPELAILSAGHKDPVQISSANGHHQQVLITSGRIAGDVGGAAYVLHDVTEREQAAKQLAVSERERLVAERRLQTARRMSAMAEVSAAIAHELNQPLAALTTYAATARRTLQTTGADLPHNLEELVGKIAAQASRSAHVVKKLRSVFEQTKRAAQVHDLNATIREALILAESELNLDRDCVTLDLANQLGLVPHDPLQLQQLILNLVRNAMDAESPSRPLQLFIQTQLVPPNRIKLSVTDNGKGIDPSLIDEIFEPLASNKQNGLGIGLSVSRSIAEAHFGTLSVETPASGGARFVLSLPHKLKGNG